MQIVHRDGVKTSQKGFSSTLDKVVEAINLRIFIYTCDEYGHRSEMKSYICVLLSFSVLAHLLDDFSLPNI